MAGGGECGRDLCDLRHILELLSKSLQPANKESVVAMEGKGERMNWRERVEAMSKLTITPYSSDELLISGRMSMGMPKNLDIN